MDSIRPAAGTGKETDFNFSKDEKGRLIGHMVLELPTKDSQATLAKIHDLGGTEKDRSSQTFQVPDTRFAKERVDVTFISHDPTTGVGSNVSAALGTVMHVLITSLKYFIIGALLLCPWLLLAWIAMKIIRGRRRKAAAATPVA